MRVAPARVVTAILLSLVVSLTVFAQSNTADQPTALKDAEADTAKQPPVSGAAQQTGKDEAPVAPDGTPTATAPAAPLTPEQAREASLLADTARLLRLAQELKTEVDKSNKDTLSIAVIKKAAEVEELARSLKERMKVPPAKEK